MKTTEKWFNTLPKEIKNKAFGNLRENDWEKEKKYSSLFEALVCAFVWSETLEGQDYWSEVSKGNFETEL